MHAILPFLQHIKLIVDKQSTNLSKQPISTSILRFIKVMNSIVEDNTFNQNLKEHNQKINSIIRKRQTKQQLAIYLHTTCLLLTPRTFMQAIK